MFRKLLVFCAVLGMLVCCTAVGDDSVLPVCKVRTANAAGTGVVFEVSQGTVFVLTNAHVVKGANSITCEFWKSGHQSVPFSGTVILKSVGVDAAVISLPDSQFDGNLPTPIPFAPRDYVVGVGDTIYSAGCANASWLTSFEGHATGYEMGMLSFVPAPASGRSGSPILDKSRSQIIGLVRARDDSGNGYAVTVQSLYSALCTESALRTAQCGPRGCPTPDDSTRLFRRPQQQPPQVQGGGAFPTLPSQKADLGPVTNKLDEIADLLKSKLTPEVPNPIVPAPPAVDPLAEKTAAELSALKADLPKLFADAAGQAIKPVADELANVKGAVAPLVRFKEKLEADAEEGGLKGKIAQRILDKMEGTDDPVLKSKTVIVLACAAVVALIVFCVWRIHNGTSMLGKLVDKVQVAGSAVALKNPALAPAIGLANVAIDGVQERIEAKIAELKARHEALEAKTAAATQTAQTAVQIAAATPVAPTK